MTTRSSMSVNPGPPAIAHGRLEKSFMQFHRTNSLDLVEPVHFQRLFQNSHRRSAANPPPDADETAKPAENSCRGPCLVKRRPSGKACQRQKNYRSHSGVTRHQSETVHLSSAPVLLYGHEQAHDGQ